MVWIAESCGNLIYYLLNFQIGEYLLSRIYRLEPYLRVLAALWCQNVQRSCRQMYTTDNMSGNRLLKHSKQLLTSLLIQFIFLGIRQDISVQSITTQQDVYEANVNGIANVFFLLEGTLSIIVWKIILWSAGTNVHTIRNVVDTPNFHPKSLYARFERSFNNISKIWSLDGIFSTRFPSYYRKSNLEHSFSNSLNTFVCNPK